MSDMMKQFVIQEVCELIKTEYQHMRYPPFMCAKIVSVKTEGDGHICTLKITDKNLIPDKRFPECPQVFTDIKVQKGDVVVVALLYGEIRPYIIGRYS